MSPSTIKYLKLYYIMFFFILKQFFYSIISLKDIPLYLNKTKIYICIYIYTHTHIMLLYLLSLEVKINTKINI